MDTDTAVACTNSVNWGVFMGMWPIVLFIGRFILAWLATRLIWHGVSVSRAQRALSAM